MKKHLKTLFYSNLFKIFDFQVKGHLDYMKKLDCVLKVVGMHTKDCDHFSTSFMTAICSNEISDEQNMHELRNKLCQSKIQDDWQSTEEHDSLDLLTSSDFDLASENSFGDSLDANTDTPSHHFHQPHNKQREVSVSSFRPVFLTSQKSTSTWSRNFKYSVFVNSN